MDFTSEEAQNIFQNSRIFVCILLVVGQGCTCRAGVHILSFSMLYKVTKVPREGPKVCLFDAGFVLLLVAQRDSQWI